MAWVAEQAADGRFCRTGSIMANDLLESAKTVPVTTGPEFKRPADLPFTCTDDALLEAVQTYLSGGELGEVARLLGVSHTQVRHWTTAKGWKFIEECVRDDVRKVAHSNLTRIVHRCFGLIEDRLEKGDPIYDLEGQVVGWRPVKVKDLAQISDTLYGKMLEIEGRTKPKENEELGLHELAMSLREWAKVKRLEATAIPGSATEVK